LIEARLSVHVQILIRFLLPSHPGEVISILGARFFARRDGVLWPLACGVGTQRQKGEADTLRQRIPPGYGALTTRRVLVVSVLVLGALLAGCGGGSENEADLDVPASPEEASSVVVRVSGTEGVAYSGDYGTIAGESEVVEDTVGAEPTDYEVQVQEGPADSVIATFEKVEPGQGELRVQILGDDKVVAEGRTLAERGLTSAEWFSGDAFGGDVPPEDEMFLPEEPEEEQSPAEDDVEVTSSGG
jgi:hypothetical protein